ncbi:PTS fructose transporter subunit IIBC [Salmonella enterica]|nr:PTS fructose transporter subunit IIBC [Salmonella enterica]
MTKKIVAVTACPTGVAHTFMAAEALEIEARKRGDWIKVETRGSVGAKNTLTAEEIAQADVVIIAADIELDLSGFVGKRLYRTSTGAALKKSAQEMDNAFNSAEVYQGSAGRSSSAGKTELPGVYKHLMTGVSHMLPLVVAGGLCIALSFVFGIQAFNEPGTLAAALFQIGGKAAFALMVPVLAGFIAFSIADRPGLAPGLIGGMLASLCGAGFLGGIVAGFLAGYSVRFLAQNIKLPASMEALKPVLVLPLLSTLITGLIMIYVVGGPVSAVMEGLTTFLGNMTSTNAILLGMLLGAMQGFDLGGPVNKAAYTFGVGLLASHSYMPMAARAKFNAAEHEAGNASFILGLCFISEGAIPFAARDPMRVIPSTMVGGAIAGGLSMYFGCTLMAPHGGLFVLAIPHAVEHVMQYLLSIALGTIVCGLMYALLKPSAVAQTV